MRKILLIFSLSLLVSSSGSQSLNYPEIFGNDWHKAVAFEKENRSWMDSMLIMNNVSYPFAVAVIFPELIRYSALRDKMEVSLLKTLYINLGETYANFSVGVFQMKPSFAEFIRENNPFDSDFRNAILFKRRPEYADVISYRKSIVHDLEDPKVEFNYLIIFIKICEKKFRAHRMNEASWLKFIATAYNSGADRSQRQIEKMIDKKYFNTKLFKTENYSYADVSLYWYNQYMSEK